jgi:hypothetical protein
MASARQAALHEHAKSNAARLGNSWDSHFIEAAILLKQLEAQHM